jgi:hypothetical protein
MSNENKAGAVQSLTVDGYHQRTRHRLADYAAAGLYRYRPQDPQPEQRYTYPPALGHSLSDALPNSGHHRFHTRQHRRATHVRSRQPRPRR